MDGSLRILLVSCALVSMLVSSSAQTCGSYTFSNNNLYTSCTDLSELGSYIHWTRHTNGTLEIAYRQPDFSSTNWIAWAINLNSTGMVGAQSLVAYVNSSAPYAYTSPVSSYSTTLAPGSLSFSVPKIEAENSNGEMIIYATLELSSSLTTVNQVWQEGPLSGGTPGTHSTTGEHVQSMGTLDLLSGQTSTGGSATSSRVRRRNIHGVLNVVSWGTLMPLGAMIARYMKVFQAADPAWFYLHVACQSSGYIVGVAGWATGIKLGSDSSTVQYDTHRNVGITLFCLGTLQLFALLLRPNKDHKYRLYWNIYHHAIGYCIIILSIFNIFEGFDILDPEEKWKRAYIGILIFLGFFAIMLEAATWYIVIKRKRESSEKYPQNGNGVNGVNGHGARTVV